MTKVNLKVFTHASNQNVIASGISVGLNFIRKWYAAANNKFIYPGHGRKQQHSNTCHVDTRIRRNCVSVLNCDPNSLTTALGKNNDTEPPEFEECSFITKDGTSHLGICCPIQSPLLKDPAVVLLSQMVGDDPVRKIGGFNAGHYPSIVTQINQPFKTLIPAVVYATSPGSNVQFMFPPSPFLQQYFSAYRLPLLPVAIPLYTSLDDVDYNANKNPGQLSKVEAEEGILQQNGPSNVLMRPSWFSDVNWTLPILTQLPGNETLPILTQPMKPDTNLTNDFSFLPGWPWVKLPTFTPASSTLKPELPDSQTTTLQPPLPSLLATVPIPILGHSSPQTTTTQPPTSIPDLTGPHVTTMRQPPRPTPPTRSTEEPNCGQPKTIGLGSKIVGGKTAGKNAWRWTAGLLKNSTRHFCGGSLIDNYHVLTAAHCVTGLSPDSLSIRLGEHDYSTETESEHITVAVSNITIHPKYNRANHNDLAIIRLASKISYNDAIQPICLDSSTDDYANQQVTVAGWGSLRWRQPPSSIIYEVTLTAWTNADCEKSFTKFFKRPAGITDHMLCAGTKGKDSCTGDSGGPLMISKNGQWVQIGIVSWGVRCGSTEHPGVYTRVNPYKKWIDEMRT